MKKLKEILLQPSSRPLAKRVIFYCTPPALLLIAAIGYLGYFSIYGYMNTAVERNVRIRSTVIARSIEDFLTNRIRDILYLRQGRIDRQTLMDFMQRQNRLDPELYREAAFISSSPATSILLVSAEGEEVRQIAPEDFSDVHPNPMVLPADLHVLEPGEVFLTSITATDYPFTAQNEIGNRKVFKIFRVLTPISEAGTPAGYLMLGIDARRLRNVLSQASTSKGKSWGYERSNEVRFSYLFDTEGWMLFQSEAPEKTEEKLSTHLARSGFIGTLGKSGLLSAFLPDKEYKNYWETVTSIRKEEGGLIRLNDQGSHQSSTVSSYFMAFEPIRYQGKAGSPPRLFTGMVYVDRSKLAFDAGKAALFMSLTWIGGGILLLGLFVQCTRSFFVRPLNDLMHQLRDRLQKGDCTPLPIGGGGKELSELAATTNELLRTLDVCEKRMAELSEHPMSETMKQPLDLSVDYRSALALDRTFPDIIGTSGGMIELKSQLLKAAGTHVDVFIVGETGTGKQLVAEAIHKHSSRRNGPFVAINCGALNEHLLLDALFGHVRGAHSEAKNDRKGAFIEATGGTLFLDEIQTASPKVQQALLRAIAERKIRPLGSDAELAVDIRLVTATNEELTQMIKEGRFREDLFYRLYVLTIQTLPLRTHREDIPLLAHHYLTQTQDFVDKTNLRFSKGAVKRLVSHDWPGNVRELVNCITRTVVFAEGQVIQADDLRMEDPETYSGSQNPPSLMAVHAAPIGTGQPEESGERQGNMPGDAREDRQTPPSSSTREAVAPTIVLSPRQTRALAVLLERKTLTRKEYQQIVDEKLPARTANYDLNDMMRKGILVRIGAGSNTRYNLSPSIDIQALQRIGETD
jgi:DNA-binding NtrC family response regulator